MRTVFVRLNKRGGSFVDINTAAIESISPLKTFGGKQVGSRLATISGEVHEIDDTVHGVTKEVEAAELKAVPVTVAVVQP